MNPVPVIVCITLCCMLCAGARADGITLYVATNGNDAWSGVVAEPSDTGDDGPLATLIGARDAIRRMKARGPLQDPVTVLIRGGRYFIDEAVPFAYEDSGTKARPITYGAYPGEAPEFIGGRVIPGLLETPDGRMVAELPDVAAGDWYFRQLFCDGKRLTRARHPNVDPDDPYRKGFLYVERGLGGFGGGVGNIHNVGDWMDYIIDIPAAGEYIVWVRYGALNAPFGRDNMAGRTALSVDGGEQVPLDNLPDTAGWRKMEWAKNSPIKMPEGRHRLRWENLEGGGLHLDAFAFTTDPAWQPRGETLPPVAEGAHLIEVQAEDYAEFHGPQLRAQSGCKTAFRMRSGDIPAKWANTPGAEVHIFQSGSCRAYKQIVTLGDIDPETGVVQVSGPECTAPLQAGDRYFIENLRAGLDAPGEWYLNRATGRLTIIPPAGYSETSDIIAPSTGRIIEFNGTADRPVEHLRLRGLRFRVSQYTPDDGCGGYGMGNNGAVYLDSAAHCSISDCSFTGLGRYAVCINGGGDNSITFNHISDSAQGGVLVLGSARNVITDNHIHDIGVVYKHIGGVVLQGAGTDDNLVGHNWIHDSSRYGITIKNGGLRNVIEFNLVERTNLETYDTGAIEVTQQDRNLRSRSIIRNNIVADSIGYSSEFEKPLRCGWGIYLDSFAGGYTVTDNICYRTSHGGIMLQGGKDNVIENNVFVDSTVYQVRISNFDSNSEGLVLRRNVIYNTDAEPLLVSTGTVDGTVLTMDENLYFCPVLEAPKISSRSAADWAAWQAAGFDAHSVWADPLFVDPAHDDYRLQYGSPAFELGFNAIDTSSVGPRARHRID